MGITNSLGKGIGEGIVKKFFEGFGKGYAISIVFIVGAIFILTKGTPETFEMYLELGYTFVLPFLGIETVKKGVKSYAERNKSTPNS